MLKLYMLGLSFCCGAPETEKILHCVADRRLRSIGLFCNLVTELAHMPVTNTLVKAASAYNSRSLKATMGDVSRIYNG